MFICMFFVLWVLSPEILVIIVVGLVVLFGGKKIPELMRGMGAGVREFKAALNEEDARADLHDCLVVTPDRALHEAISLTVRKLFRRTATAMDRESAERALSTVHPLIAVVDLDLPDMEAFYLIPFIKNTTGASVIALSSTEDDERPWKSGVGAGDGYLVKPFTEEALLNLIKELLDRRNQPPADMQVADGMAVA